MNIFAQWQGDLVLQTVVARNVVISGERGGVHVERICPVQAADCVLLQNFELVVDAPDDVRSTYN